MIVYCCCVSEMIMHDSLLNPYTHEHWMRQAFHEAEKAFARDEVPVGAVVVKNNRIIGRGYNQVEALQDPTAHAEMLAITAACENLGSKLLTDCALYVTLEPCPMCAGAIVHAKIKTLIYGAADPKTGACDSLYHIPEDPRLNHRVAIVSDVLREECAGLLLSFFRKKR